MTFVDNKTSSGARFSALSLLLFLFLSAVALSARTPDTGDGVKAAPLLSLQIPLSYRSNGPDGEERTAAKAFWKPEVLFWNDEVTNVYSFDLQIILLFAFSARGPPPIR